MKLKYILLLFIVSAVSSSEIDVEKLHAECMKGATSRFYLKHREHNGIGYDVGYTTLGIFLAPKTPAMVMPFFDARGHRFTNNRYAANVGMGLRVRTSDGNFVFGANAFYDFRFDRWIDPQQVGAGIELLSKWIDFRANGYYPVFQKKRTKSTSNFVGFSGNGVLLEERFRGALSVAEAEVGVPLGTIVDLYIAAGPYYLFKRRGPNIDCGNVWGGKARITAQLYDGISAGLIGTYDKEFHGTIQGYLALNLPIGPATMQKKGARWKRWFKAQECNEYALAIARQTQDVIRNEIIPICKATGSTFMPLAQNIIFVNNSNPSAGDGTFENPFMNLALAEGGSEEGDIIYVFPGNFTYLEGFVFQQGQLLQSSAKDLSIDGINIPAQTPGNLPIITNPGGPGIIMADQTSIVGFSLLANNGEGILVDNVTDISILCNTITQNAQGGIIGDNTAGNIYVAQNSISENFGRSIFLRPALSNLQFSQNTIEDGDGLVVIPNANNTVITITDNTFSNNLFAALGLGDVVFPGNFSNVTITNNDFIDTGISIQYQNNPSGGVVSIINNDFFNVSTSQTGQLTVAGFDDLVFQGNSMDLPVVSPFVHTAFELGDNANFTLRNNFLNLGSVVDSINVAITGTNTEFQFLNNTLINPGSGNGLLINSSAGTSSNSTVEQNTITASAFGIEYQVTGTHRSQLLTNDLGALGSLRMSTSAGTGNLCIELQNNEANPGANSYEFLNGNFMRVATDTGNFATSNNIGNATFTGFPPGEEVVAPLPAGCSP